MKQFFDALERKYPGSKVIDVKFSINQNDIPEDFDLDKFDKELAEAIENAEEIDIASVFG